MKKVAHAVLDLYQGYLFDSLELFEFWVLGVGGFNMMTCDILPSPIVLVETNTPKLGVACNPDRKSRSRMALNAFSSLWEAWESLEPQGKRQKYKAMWNTVEHHSFRMILLTFWFRHVPLTSLALYLPSAQHLERSSKISKALVCLRCVCLSQPTSWHHVPAFEVSPCCWASNLSLQPPPAVQNEHVVQNTTGLLQAARSGEDNSISSRNRKSWRFRSILAPTAGDQRISPPSVVSSLWIHLWKAKCFHVLPESMALWRNQLWSWQDFTGHCLDGVDMYGWERYDLQTSANPGLLPMLRETSTKDPIDRMSWDQVDQGYGALYSSWSFCIFCSFKFDNSSTIEAWPAWSLWNKMRRQHYRHSMQWKWTKQWNTHWSLPSFVVWYCLDQYIYNYTYIHIYIYLFIYVFIYLFIYLSIYFTYLFIYLCIYLFE